MLSEGRRKELKIFSKRMQMEVMRTIACLGVGHVGGSLSICDTLAVLYGEELRHDPKKPDWPERDRLVMSKGHAGPAAYAALALRGFMPLEELQTLNRPHTHLPSHCDRNLTPGIDMTTGSLGQGASVAAGMALGLRMQGMDSRVYLVLGDGEIEEGQVWEMALFAAHRKLGNLIAFVDYNKLQIDGYTDEVCKLGDVAEKFRSFGWHAQSIDGHDIDAIYNAVEAAKAQSESPSVIVLNTVKGQGWDKTHNQVGSHHRPVSQAELEDALAQMQAALNEYLEA